MPRIMMSNYGHILYFSHNRNQDCGVDKISKIFCIPIHCPFLGDIYCIYSINLLHIIYHAWCSSLDT
uniref:Uncharacterized protein n=1 Tax=Aegilops tauschii subsp. strangulata TaxID=200361 RepID=A0A453DMF7_AEGTS